MKTLRAEFQTNWQSGQNCILVKVPTIGRYDETIGKEILANYNVWDGIVEHCCKEFSNKQMLDIYEQLECYFVRTSPDDVPIIYREIFQDFKEAMKNRNLLR